MISLKNEICRACTARPIPLENPRGCETQDNS